MQNVQVVLLDGRILGGFNIFFFHLTMFSKFCDMNLINWTRKIKVSLQYLLSSVQSLSCVWLFATPWTAAYQASLSITNSQSLLQVMLDSDAIQPSHPLSSPSPPAFNLSQHQGLFKRVSSLHQVAKVLEFQLQHQSFQWIFRTEFL